jgi:predicted NAD/FAD-binding protein
MSNIAIIGTGIAGLGAAHFLHPHHTITLFEKNDYPGGHTNTITVDEAGRPVPIDTGFMVFNHATYPNLVRLFAELGVATQKTDMSFSVQHVPSDLEYNGGSLNLLFGQRRNLLRINHWKMLLAINRFNEEAVAALTEPRWAEMSLREYIDARGYGETMFQHYLVPMSSAVWSTPPEKMEAFPAQTLLRFWQNHGFLGLSTQHQWWTVTGGSQSYVRKLTAPFADRLQLRRSVSRITRTATGATLHFREGPPQTFDKVILACHGDQAMALLGDPTELESRLLSRFSYQPNTATLHTDSSLMPRTRRCWAAWNYRIDTAPDGGVRPTTHYWMNRLQRVSEKENYFVSLNCHDRIHPGKVLRRIDYEHPLFDLAAIKAQEELPALNALSPDQTTYYAGAWFKYGFHEDGFTSGLNAARAILQGNLPPAWS